MAPDWATNILRTCLSLRPGESVLVLVDEPLRHAGEALCAAAGALGAGAAACTVLHESRGLSAVPTRVLGQVQAADVLVSLRTSLNLATEDPVMRAMRAAFAAGGRGRWAAGAGIDADVFTHEFLADYADVSRRADELAARLAGADEVHITSAAGTNLRLSISGRPVHRDGGILNTPGAYGNLPAGEAFVAPLEESVEGRLVVDLCMGDIALAEPVALQFRQGRVVAVEGGAGARALEQRLGDDPWAWTAGEFGVGANPWARPCGQVTVAEKALGTAHVALGGNGSLGGRNPAATHYDCVFRAPVITLDGKAL